MIEFNDTLSVERGLPPMRSFSKPFWDATLEKRLLLQYDRVADAYQFYPRATSIYTGRSANLEWREVSGRGAVFSYTIVRRGPPAFREHEPYCIAMVTLDEGVNMMANVIRCSPEAMRAGLRVKLDWLPLSDGRHLAMFEPDQ